MIFLSLFFSGSRGINCICKKSNIEIHPELNRYVLTIELFLFILVPLVDKRQPPLDYKYLNQGPRIKPKKTAAVTSTASSQQIMWTVPTLLISLVIASLL